MFSHMQILIGFQGEKRLSNKGGNHGILHVQEDLYFKVVIKTKLLHAKTLQIYKCKPILAKFMTHLWEFLENDRAFTISKGFWIFLLRVNYRYWKKMT